MKGIFFIVNGISFFALLSICSGHSNSNPSLSTSMHKGPDISLAASVERVRFCTGDNEVFTAHLSLALRYTNLSSTKAILYKSRQPIEIFSGAIGESPTALQEKRYEATFQYDQFTEPPSSPDGQRPSSSEFVILEPEKKYDLRAIVAVAVRFKAVPAHSGTIAPGNHTMTVDVVDWPFFPEDGARLRKRWADLGTLRYEGIKTAPFQFTLEATPPLEDCSIGHRVPAGGPRFRPVLAKRGERGLSALI